MNTARSSALGWGALVVAAGASYYWARQGIDERRRKQEIAGTRSTEKLDWRARIERDAENSSAASAGVVPVDKSGKMTDTASSTGSDL